MSYEQSVSNHYLHGNLLGAIEAAIPKLGKSVGEITVDDLGPVDEFHIGGRVATDRLLKQLDFTERHHILDVGCGLGGASRFVADRYRSRVTGIDLAQEYIDTGTALCRWVGLAGHVSLRQGSALDMPFENESFDGALMLHVGMNIGDKDGLFREIHRVLRPGSVLGVYDVMRTNEGELTYPVPWASEASTSKLATIDEYRKALHSAGFDVRAEDNRADFALEFFKQMKAKNEAMGGPPPLGLHTLMQKATPLKLQNMVGGISAGLIAPVEMIARKPAMS